MKKMTINLEAFTKYEEFELLDVSRRKQYKDGEATENFDTVYQTLINYEPIDIRINDDGAIAEQADLVRASRQDGEPLLISFDNCLITVSPKSQYELAVRGTAQKATLSESE